jgi:outer membrane protein assembly factor BamA
MQLNGKEEAMRAASAQFTALLDEGYLMAHADTIVGDSSILMQVKPGKLYLLGDFIMRESEGTLLQWRINAGMTGASRERAFSRALAIYENEGYPFASIRIDSIAELPANRLSGKDRVNVFTSLEKGPLVVNDSLYVKSTTPLPAPYLLNYIDFKKGKLYNEYHILQTERRLREIPFIQIKRPPEVRFQQGKADLYVFVERKKANYFNGVAGLRPDEATGKVNVTGDAEIRLMNAFNRGEEWGVVWRKLQPQTQDLSLRAMVPYIFNTPVAVDGRLHIYKRDTSFTAVKLLGGVGFILPRNQRIRVFVERNRSDQLTAFYSASAITNSQQTLYGLSLQLENLDYRWNPRKGLQLQTEVATGFRLTNNPLGEDNRAVRRPMNRLDGQVDYYIPVFGNQTLLMGAKGGAIFSDSLYENEALRIGGLRTIRGINEESIFASAWCVGTLEYRLILEENSAVYLFVDQAWYEYRSVKAYGRDLPLNMGAGFNFDTRAGIFTFNYAIGKQFDNPVLIRNGKVSFGFRSLF